jgi:hypothetical protein
MASVGDKDRIEGNKGKSLSHELLNKGKLKL